MSKRFDRIVDPSAMVGQQERVGPATAGKASLTGR